MITMNSGSHSFGNLCTEEKYSVLTRIFTSYCFTTKTTSTTAQLSFSNLKYTKTC